MPTERRDAADASTRAAAVRRVVAAGPLGDHVHRLVAHTARLLDAPSAQISLVGDTVLVVPSAHEDLRGALPPREEPVEGSLCAVAVRAGTTLVVEDAAVHPLVRHLPAVADGVVGAYVGTVLVDCHGEAVGCLSASGPRPRRWAPEHVEQLRAVADLVQAELAAHVAAAEDLAQQHGPAADAADLGTFSYDPAGGGRLEWDRRMCHLHGTTPEEFDGSVAGFERLVVQADLPGLARAVARSQRGTGELAVEYRTRAGGEERWVRARGRLVPDMLGRPGLVVGTAYDATTEHGLRDQLDRLTETMPAALVRLDREWTITYVNSKAEDILGAGRDALLGQDVHDVLPDLAGSTFGQAYARAMATGRAETVEDYFPPLDAWFEVHAWPDEHGLTLFNHDVTDRARTGLALEQTRRRLAVLAEAGARLSGSLQPRETLERLSGILVPSLGCSVTIAVTEAAAELFGEPAGNDPDRLRVVHVHHVDPAREAELRELLAQLDLRAGAGSGLGRAVSTGRPQHYERVPDDLLRARARDDRQLEVMRGLNVGPQLTVPLAADGRVVGALTVAGAAGETLDQDLLVELAGRGAVALETALAYARQHQAATVLQRALLPKHTSDTPGVLVATRYLPAAEQSLAGGDFFRRLMVDGVLVCAIGDVMGHGTASAARAGQLHGLVATLALQGMQPGELLTRLSAGVDQLMDLELATLLVCAYDPATRRLTTASAGHPPPLVAPPVGSPCFVDVAPGPPLGVAAARYEQRTVQVPTGGTVVLYTDGLVERRDESLTVGLERLRQAVAELRMPPEAVADHLLRATGVAAGAQDDIALLVLSQP